MFRVGKVFLVEMIFDQNKQGPIKKEEPIMPKENPFFMTEGIHLNLFASAAYVFLLTLFLVTMGCSTSNPADPDDVGITVPPGFKATVFADNIGRARHLTINDNGDVYVALRLANQGGGIVAIRDEDGDHRADVITHFGKLVGTGIHIHRNYLYFGSDTTVVRYLLNPGQLVPDGEPEPIAVGFGYETQHAAKPFDFDGEGNMYVNVGAPANACQEQMRTPGSPGMDPCPLLEKYGGIWRFDAGQKEQHQLVEGFRYASGIRHAVALAWNPLVDQLYIVQHGRDQLSHLFPNLFNDEQNAELPAEEFLLIKEGGVYGWPYTYYDQIQGKRVLAPEYGGDGKSTERCEQYDDPIMAFPGHWAPNDLLFYTGDQFPDTYKGGAFVAFHGSWNRAPLPQRGFNVVFVPFDGVLPSGPWEVFADGFAGKKVIKSVGEARFRPMGLAVAPDGSLFISDSVKGRIWRVHYEGE